MTYRRGGLIEAATFNNFADILNKVYTDTYQNGVTPLAEVNYGYGATPQINHVAVGNLVTAANWTSLFNVITLCGTHLGISVAPIPASVSTGQLIAAYNNYLTEQTLHEVIGTIVSNRYNTTPGQLSVSSLGTMSTSSLVWTTGAVATFTITFSSYNSARYFFNTRGNIRISGSYTPPGSGATSVDYFWQQQLMGMNTVLFSSQWTVPENFGQSSNLGFYDLTTSDQEVYRRGPVTDYVYYSNDFIKIEARLIGNIAFFKITLTDNDNGVQAKTGQLAFNIGKTQSSGAIPNTSTLTFASGAFSTVGAVAYPGQLLSITPIPLAVTGFIDGPGTAISDSCSIRAVGGLQSHPSCYVGTVAALSNSPTYTTVSAIGYITATTFGSLFVDGLPISALDANGAPTRILVKNQGVGSWNGIYEVISTGGISSLYKLARVADFPSYVPGGVAIQTKTSWSGDYTYIQSGTYADQTLQLTTANPIQIGNTAQTWALYPGGGPYTFSWTAVSGDSVSITSPTSKSTTLSKSLSSGQIAQGQVRCTVTDIGSGLSASVKVPWALTSNNLN